MEYIQGNSIGTMLARKEGFSIWDLLDIGRQLCSGLEHAKSHNIVHYSLEPSKIMCGWDGTTKILGYGVSSVGNFVQHVTDGVPSILHYMSPEQIRGEATDNRSNLFSLGAIFYEMVTERKAFDREDAESLRQSILESTPVPPLHVNAKVHPLLSDLIMKALAKDPAERYQNGRELLDDLEKCKESRPAAKKAEAPKAPSAPKASPVAQAKFAAPVAAKPAARPVAAAARPVVSKPVEPRPVAPAVTAAPKVEAKPSVLAKPASRLAMPKAAAAAAGVGGEGMVSSPEISEVEAPNESMTSSVAETTEAAVEAPAAYMSSAVADEPEVETFEPQVETFEPQVAEEGPKIAVDPMMSEGGAKSGGSVSFSEMTELPPLKEVYIAPPPPPADPAPVAAAPATRYQSTRRADEKPKVQPREVAQKAIKEIKGVPPKLMGYAIGGALALIVAIGIGVTIYVHSLNSDDDTGDVTSGSGLRDARAGRQPASTQERTSASPAGGDSAGPERTAASNRRGTGCPHQGGAQSKEEGGGCTRCDSRAARD